MNSLRGSAGQRKAGHTGDLQNRLRRWCRIAAGSASLTALGIALGRDRLQRIVPVDVILQGHRRSRYIGEQADAGIDSDQVGFPVGRKELAPQGIHLCGLRETPAFQRAVADSEKMQAEASNAVDSERQGGSTPPRYRLGRWSRRHFRWPSR